MTKQTRPLARPAHELPPILQADLAGPKVERRGWAWTIGPAFTGVFIWIPLLDGLGTWIPGEPLAGLALTSVLAVIACHFLLYLVPAEWGWTAGQRLSVVAASTFGTEGSEQITGLGLGLAAILVHAISLFMAIRLTLLGLLLCGLTTPQSFSPWALGPITLPNPVALLTCAFWIFIIGMLNKLGLVSVIVGLMKVYTPVALLLLVGTAMLTSPGLLTFDAARQALDLPGGQPGGAQGPVWGKAEVFQRIFAYFAMSGLVAVDWGMALRHPRDIRIGGWISIILAGSYATVLSLLTVAGAVGKLRPGLAHQADGLTVPLTFHWAVFHGIGGVAGGALLLLFGLATLAPGCYAVDMAARRFSARWPHIRRSAWIWLCGLAAFLLVAVSWAGRIEQCFGLLGAVFAPAAGALVADSRRQRGRWPGIRRGWNPPGIVAWSVGALVGLVPLLGDLFHWPLARRFQPASLFAFLVAACVFLLVSALGRERP